MNYYPKSHGYNPILATTTTTGGQRDEDEETVSEKY